MPLDVARTGFDHRDRIGDPVIGGNDVLRRCRDGLRVVGSTASCTVNPPARKRFEAWGPANLPLSVPSVRRHTAPIATGGLAPCSGSEGFNVIGSAAPQQLGQR